MAGAAHDVVEGDFEDDERLDGAEVALVLEGVRFEEFGELGDLRVGDAGVGFADVEKFSGAGEVGTAYGEGVVREQASALPAAVLGAGDDDIEGGEQAFELDPG